MVILKEMNYIVLRSRGRTALSVCIAALLVCCMSFYLGSIQTAENAEDVQGANMGVLEVVITAAMILLATGLSVILVNRKFKQESIELLNRKSD